MRWRSPRRGVIFGGVEWDRISGHLGGVLFWDFGSVYRVGILGVEEEERGFGGIRLVRNLNNLFVELVGSSPWAGRGSWRMRPLHQSILEEILETKHSKLAGL
jgi:hypothetical protein